MVFPLLIPVIVTAAIAILGTGAGVAISNWTSKPTTVVYDPEDDVYTNTGNTSGIPTNLLLIGGLAIAAIFLFRK